MTRPPQPELFASDRPVRSFDARERSYARRRFVTIIVLVVLLGGGAYALWGRGPVNPANIPTVQAEGSYKQKPADPGGIDIPHQDVRVYDQLEGKNGAPVQVEHLLPPPETPKDIPHVAPASDATAVTPSPLAASPAAAVVAPVPPAAVAATPAPEILPAPIAKTVVTTVTPTPLPPTTGSITALPPTPIPAATSALSIEQVIANTKAPAVAPPAPTPSATTPASPSPAPVAATLLPSGMVAVQLASSNDEAKARTMMQEMQQKYTSQLGSTTLHLVRADLGSRGIFYRIQSQGLSESDANHICSSLKQMNAGCILVRK